jgi:hypothetical protein
VAIHFISRKGPKAQRKGAALLRAFAPSRETSFSGLLSFVRNDGEGSMKDILKIVVAIVVIIVVWKIIKGLIGLLVGLVVAGLIVYGAVKLVENVGQKRLK